MNDVRSAAAMQSAAAASEPEQPAQDPTAQAPEQPAQDPTAQAPEQPAQDPTAQAPEQPAQDPTAQAPEQASLPGRAPQTEHELQQTAQAFEHEPQQTAQAFKHELQQTAQVATWNEQPVDPSPVEPDRSEPQPSQTTGTFILNVTLTGDHAVAIGEQADLLAIAQAALSDFRVLRAMLYLTPTGAQIHATVDNTVAVTL